MNNTHVYTISEITRNIKSILETQFPKIWIEGEISNLRISQSGHTYLTLKDESSQIQGVIFKTQNSLLGGAFQLKNGLQVIVYGNISVYEKGGSYQIIIQKWEPKGIGALQLAFEELKQKLFNEGLFDQKHKKAIPVLPSVIGVITSPSGAAIRDILNVIDRRFSNINILLYPVRVQGDGAAEEIAQAIDEMSEMPEIDVIIVGRGGGSLEDLWEFNEECVARSIYRCRIPVISAVGHEIDYTICDFVSDLRAPTPSAAAELVIGEKDEFIKTINYLKHKLESSISSYLLDIRHRLDRASSSYVFKEPLNALLQYSQRLDDLFYRLKTKIIHLQEINRHIYSTAFSRLQSLNPKSIINRGYSITTHLKSGKIITQHKSVVDGDEIETTVADGCFKSVVKS